MNDWPFGELRPQKYRCVAIDYPSKFKAGEKGRPQHYPRMTDQQIAEMPLAQLAHPDGCFFFAWICSPQNERFWRVIWPAWRAQGLRYSARAFVWLKTHKASSRGAPPMFFHRDSFHCGMGYTTRKNAEDCLLFKAGKPKRQARNIREEIVSPIRAHSQKPDEFFERVERFCDGPYVELFARTSRNNWDAWGNETGKFDGEKAA